jgi:nucleoside phosphorylase
MASGGGVIDKPNELDNIAKQVSRPKLCSVDMESYAIFRVCQLLNVKSSVIKSVMDLSNNKSDKYKDYACYLAANFFYSIINDGVITV